LGVVEYQFTLHHFFFAEDFHKINTFFETEELLAFDSCLSKTNLFNYFSKLEKLICRKGSQIFINFLETILDLINLNY